VSWRRPSRARVLDSIAHRGRRCCGLPARSSPTGAGKASHGVGRGGGGGTAAPTRAGKERPTTTIAWWACCGEGALDARCGRSLRPRRDRVTRLPVGWLPDRMDALGARARGVAGVGPFLELDALPL